MFSHVFTDFPFCFPFVSRAKRPFRDLGILFIIWFLCNSKYLRECLMCVEVFDVSGLFKNF